MTAFDRYMPVKAVEILDLVSDCAVMILALIMLIVGLSYAFKIGSRGSYISMPWLSKFWQYFPIPLAGVAMIFFELERIVMDIGHLMGYYGQFGVDTEAEELEKMSEKAKKDKKEDK